MAVDEAASWQNVIALVTYRLSHVDPFEGNPEVFPDPVNGRLSDEQVHHKGREDGNEDDLLPPVPQRQLQVRIRIGRGWF